LQAKAPGLQDIDFLQGFRVMNGFSQRLWDTSFAVTAGQKSAAPPVFRSCDEAGLASQLLFLILPLLIEPFHKYNNATSVILSRRRRRRISKQKPGPFAFGSGGQKYVSEFMKRCTQDGKSGFARPWLIPRKTGPEKPLDKYSKSSLE
jgi:hypothetical protein